MQAKPELYVRAAGLEENDFLVWVGGRRWTSKHGSFVF